MSLLAGLSQQGDSISAHNADPAAHGLSRFIPISSGLVGAWDYRYTTLDGSSKISSFTDVSGLGHDLTQSDAGARWGIADGCADPGLSSSNPVGYSVTNGITVPARSMTFVFIGPARYAVSQTYGSYFGPTSTCSLFRDGYGNIIVAGVTGALNHSQSRRANVVALVYNGTTATLNVNGATASATSTAQAGNVTIGTLFGPDAGNGARLKERMVACQIFNRPLATWELDCIAAAYGVVSSGLSCVNIGDSLTAGFGATVPANAWAHVLSDNLGANAYNRGLNGITALEISQDLSSIVVCPQRRTTFTLLAGTNDLIKNRDVTELEGSITTICQYIRANFPRAKIIVGTLPPCGSSVYYMNGQTYAGFETARQTFRTWLLANYSAFSDAVADIAADATIGVQSAANDSSKYIDGIHGTDATYVRFANIFLAAATWL